MSLRILDHPLASDLMAKLRHKDTQPDQFRVLSNHLTTLLAIEATRGMRTKRETVTTPLESFECDVLDQGLVVVPILRAGLGMLDPILALFEDVKVGYIGLERHHDTAIAHSYYCKLPTMGDRLVLCVDPMLATGGSASQAVSLIRASGAKEMVMVSVVATPEGVARLTADHPDVTIVTAAVDRGLNAQKYILPGLGDYGDRLFGTD